jgi:hypothetical protein
MKMKKNVVNFFVKHYHPDFNHLSEYEKYSTKVEKISKVLNIDWLFYNFIERDYRCTDFLQSIYHCVITSPQYYWDKRPDDYITCIHNLNNIILFREILANELIKIVGHPKRVNVKWSRYRSGKWMYEPFKIKSNLTFTTYGEDFKSTALKVMKILKRSYKPYKIHKIKIYRDYGWNHYRPEFYKAYMKVMFKTGVTPVLKH